MSASPAAAASSSSSSPSSDVSPQQIGKAFVVQYYRLLHEHPESLHRFYSSASTLMHDDPTKTVTGTEAIAKRIEQLSFKQRHVKIRQVDCHSTVGSAVVVQVCGEISSSLNDPNTMKRFVQTFVLAPTEQAKQKYYVHNDIFRYQDTPLVAPSTPTEGKSPSSQPNEANSAFSSLAVPTSKIEFVDNSLSEKKEEKSPSAGAHMTPPVTPVDTQEKEATSKPKSYRDAIGKAEKPVAAVVTANESQQPATGSNTNNNNKSKKANKQQQQPQQKSNKGTGNANNRSTRGHPQDVNEFFDDSWYYSTADEGYLSTGYTDDQEVFVGHLSAQVTENEVRFQSFLLFSSPILSSSDSRTLSSVRQSPSYSDWQHRFSSGCGELRLRRLSID